MQMFSSRFDCAFVKGSILNIPIKSPSIDLYKSAPRDPLDS